MAFPSPVFFVLACFLLSYQANSQHPCESRIAVRDGYQGFIHSPNYPRRYSRNADCSYFLSSNQPSTIKLSFSGIDLEQHSSCRYDFLSIHDGPSTASPQLAKLCGSIEQQFNITSSGSDLTIRFRSDGSDQGHGFSLTFETVPEASTYYCNELRTVKHGRARSITSPNYPGSYPNGSDCTYILMANHPSYSVRFFFGGIDLEQHDSCLYNYVAVYDGPSTNSHQLAKFCGNIQRQPEMSSSGRFLTVKFHFGGSAQGNGFTMTYSIGQRITSFGSRPITRHIRLPGHARFYAPTVSETSTNVIEVFGRKVYLSNVHQRLVENTDGRFPLTQTSYASPQIEVIIKADTVYINQSLVFQGLKKLSIKARKLVSNGGNLSLVAPAVCQSTNGWTCSHLDKASNMMDGTNGRDGAASPVVEIYLYDLQGTVNILSKGSNGEVGEEGGNGDAGADRRWRGTSVTDDSWCRKRSIYHCRSRKLGYRGPQGGNGRDGRKSGIPGSGGKASTVTLYTVNLSGFVTLKQHPGSGGAASEHGRGGRAGYGGYGGCGMDCNGNIGIFTRTGYKCEGTRKCDYAFRGPPGSRGKPGRHGSLLYSPTEMGYTGVIGSADMRAVRSVKRYFRNETKLLELIHREAESLYQRNDNANARNAFEFLRSVANESFGLYHEASLRLKMINEGFDYYGHTEMYAPDLDWSYFYERTNLLFESGSKFEDSYNRVMEEVEDVVLISGTMQFAMTTSIRTEHTQLASDEVALRNEKQLYVKSLKQLERTMNNEILEMKELLPRAMKPPAPNALDVFSKILSVLVGLSGIVTGVISRNPTEALTGALGVVNAMRTEPSCDVPTITEASKTLKERMTFGYAYQAIAPEDLDFSTMNVSAVPIIMKSDLEKNKEILVTELRCLFSHRDRDAVANLERVIKTFYSDAGFRIALIDRVVNIDVQLKKISFSRGLLAETQQMVDDAVSAAQNNLPMNIKRSFSDYMYSLYQEQENNIMRTLYELSKAYQFSCLWKFDALEKYNDLFGSEVMTSNLDSLEGISELQNIRQELEDQKDVFLRLFATTAGPSSHIYYPSWEFRNATHPEIFKTLYEGGRFSLSFELNPNDRDSTAGCHGCYNGRLIALYVQLLGEYQPSTVPDRIYVSVAHMGDSSFLIPLGNGRQRVETLRQTPEDVDGGHVMSFHQSNSVMSFRDQQSIRANFSREEYNVCDESESFFGKKPCKSPYASYVITVPRDDHLPCTSDRSGINCRDLDFTRFNAIRVYAKVRSWSNYPVQPDNETLKRHVRDLRAVETAEQKRL